MKAGGSGPKGGAFERECSKRLSLWISKGERDDLYWRTAMSGGRATLQARKDILNEAQQGDIGCIDSEGEEFLRKYVIECKFYKKLDITLGMLSNRGFLYLFWEKIAYDAYQARREPMLIARQNRTPTMLLTTKARLDGKDYSRDALVQFYRWTGGPLLFMFDRVMPPIDTYSGGK